jgi:hypothetical protein
MDSGSEYLFLPSPQGEKFEKEKKREAFSKISKRKRYTKLEQFF